MNKTIFEVKAAKERLEGQISCLLRKFEEENGVHISDLSIYPSEIYDGYGETIDRQIRASIIVKI